MIRCLTSEEVPLLIEGGREFFEEGKIPGGLRADHFIASWQSFIESKDGRILGLFSDGGELLGMLGFIVHPDMNNGDRIAVECFWFVRKPHRGQGLQLFEEFERQAKDMGAVRLAMIHLERLQPEKLSNLYERMGYTLIERHYVKEVA